MWRIEAQPSIKLYIIITAGKHGATVPSQSSSKCYMLLSCPILYVKQQPLPTPAQSWDADKAVCAGEAYFKNW